METRHFPPQGQSLIAGGHTASPTCVCDPARSDIRRRQTSGRGGSGQGYKVVSVNYIHNKI